LLFLFFFQDVTHIAEGKCPRLGINVLDCGLSLAGFQVIRDGRFWVITEEKICQFDGICIVDTGATTFVPLWNYILENEILCFLAARLRRVFVHSVVAGGQAMSDTLNGLERLAETTTREECDRMAERVLRRNLKRR
jgi:hypothetical protein